MKRKMYRVLISKPMFAQLHAGDIVIYDPAKSPLGETAGWRRVDSDPRERSSWWGMLAQKQALERGFVERIK